MGKEVKIGLAVVGVLLVVFSGLLVRRFMIAGQTAASPVETAQSSRLHSAPLPASNEPTVVTAERDSASGGGVHAIARGARGEVPADIPHGSFLPADAPSDSESAVADNDSPNPASDANPFARRVAGRDAVKGAEEAPNTLEVGPEDAAALEARQPPARSTRNPLRRLSAEVPLDVNPADLTLDDPQPATGAELAEEQPANEEPLEPQPVAESLESPADESLAAPATLPAEPVDEPAPAVAQPRSRYQMPADPPAVVEEPTTPAAPANGQYTIQPNDSLWKISEKVYGSGRYFKAIQEHNRAKLPQPDRLVAGTVIAVPPASELEDRYPSLCPKQRRSAVVKTRTLSAGASGPAAAAVPASAATGAGGDVYVVAEGDTLFDIARYELGKASRWGEIYELNRDALGEDFDYLQPGLELKMPERRGGAPVSREPSSRYQR